MSLRRAICAPPSLRARMLEATEWLREEDFLRLKDQYSKIELMSTAYFSR
jgi:hypothetical protein